MGNGPVAGAPGVPSVAPFRAAIFDMDGVLIDSEPFWHEAETGAFGRVGISLTSDQWAPTMGMPVNEVVDLWYRRHPWRGTTRQQVQDAIVDQVVERIRTCGALGDGAIEAVDFLRHKGLMAALASSSPYRVIRAVLDLTALADRFQVVHSAEEEREGKPHPAVYIATARKLGVPPASCLAIEDSPNGVAAAKSAGMTCVAIPNASFEGRELFREADIVVPSLRHIDETLWTRLLTARQPTRVTAGEARLRIP